MAIPDEVWERFENDSERDIRASAPKEPSARARMVAERLRRLDEEAARQEAARAGRLRRRRAKKDAEPVRWRPDDWRAAPTGPPGGGRSERSRRSRRVWSVVIVFGGMAAAIVLLSPLRFSIWGR
ncbi:hypothetical protein [Streptomyces sp. NRRL S-1521]|uniref:hypothetical protein n=1 Tax=Streptomyces sp. NRRL S-1521 TaxID=1609100 RepID=UPI000746841F|nr:hypothetical protein [Streptomyces sp. NRRL S-1521]KUL54555.1 hypothetical protein ADL30_15935 [Streptomyces sp. NRRL S-1521]